MDDLERIARAICRADYNIKNDKDQIIEALSELLAAEDIPKGMWRTLQDKGRYRRYARVAERFFNGEEKDDV